MSTTTTARPASAPPQPPSHGAAAQTSQSYHHGASASATTNANPFLTPTRPRIDQPATPQSSAPVSMADRVRSMSTSSLISAPVVSASVGDDARTIDSKQNAGGGKSKDMFAWFSETVIISQIVRSWPS